MSGDLTGLCLYMSDHLTGIMASSITIKQVTYCEAVVCFGGHSVELHGQISSGKVEIFGRKTCFGQLNLNGCSIANVVKAVLHHSVHALYQVLVLNLKFSKY